MRASVQRATMQRASPTSATVSAPVRVVPYARALPVRAPASRSPGTLPCIDWKCSRSIVWQGVGRKKNGTMTMMDGTLAGTSVREAAAEFTKLNPSYELLCVSPARRADAEAFRWPGLCALSYL